MRRISRRMARMNRPHVNKWAAVLANSMIFWGVAILWHQHHLTTLIPVLGWYMLGSGLGLFLLAMWGVSELCLAPASYPSSPMRRASARESAQRMRGKQPMRLHSLTRRDHDRDHQHRPD